MRSACLVQQTFSGLSYLPELPPRYRAGPPGAGVLR